jgi:hypothetical protein
MSSEVSQTRADWVQQEIVTGRGYIGNAKLLPVYSRAKVGCRVCGAVYYSADIETQTLIGPYICKDHPIQRFDFEFDEEKTAVAGGSPSPPAIPCDNCGCNLSRYNKERVCALCARKENDEPEG